jgi:hypothetical protein
MGFEMIGRIVGWVHLAGIRRGTTSTGAHATYGDAEMGRGWLVA